MIVVCRENEIKPLKFTNACIEVVCRLFIFILYFIVVNPENKNEMKNFHVDEKKGPEMRLREGFPLLVVLLTTNSLLLAFHSRYLM